jgi:hypothetical protein
MGRRNITLVGCALLLIGIGLVGGARTFGQAVTGMALSGAGAGIGELTALAGQVDSSVVRYTTSNFDQSF